MSSPLAALILTRDPEQFARQAGDFLAERAERNVAATVLASALAGRFAGSGPLFGYARARSDRVSVAVLRTPPWPLLVSDLDPALAPSVLDRWIAEDPEVPGVSGLPESCRALAVAWQRWSGGQTRLRMQMALHSLDHVLDPPRPAPGSLRLAKPSERGLLVEWNRAFEQEAEMTADGRTEALVDDRLGHGGWLIWDDGGPVTLVGVNRAVAGAVRLGPVYTPPDRRNRGYATSAVAATSRRALSEGARRCLLFTDLANPTSNRIYAQVGYRRLGAWEEHSFEAPSTGS